MTEPAYRRIVEHYEECLSRHGPSAKGMDWPNQCDLATRFDVMLGVLRSEQSVPVSLLDLGCGVGLLLDHLSVSMASNACDYWGVDVSEKMIEAARARHSGRRFNTRDILADPLPPRCVDYVIMNGVLTEKCGLAQDLMEDYACTLIQKAFAACRCGLAFNVMSDHVDWRREDLFHWSLDRATTFLIKECSRHVVIRMDYGLYEYTVYVYREPRR